MFREADRNRAFKTLATIERVERTDWHRSHHDMLQGVTGQLKSLVEAIRLPREPQSASEMGIYIQALERAEGRLERIEMGQSVLKADLDALRDQLHKYGLDEIKSKLADIQGRVTIIRHDQVHPAKKRSKKP